MRSTEKKIQSGFVPGFVTRPRVGYPYRANVWSEQAGGACIVVQLTEVDSVIIVGMPQLTSLVDKVAVLCSTGHVGWVRCSDLVQ